uniref:Ubiquitin thioesterase OTU1 n=1 Tax=Camelus bactrianus TaxID=9837 RepID=A0A9W3GH14_CAMBA|nr:ubiquitin thioesterase OTU1 isoform X3 [Camelus bactrianus]
MFGPAKGGHFGVRPAAGIPGGVCQPAAGTKTGSAGVWPVGGWTDTMWRLRCKAKDGTHVLQGLSSRTRVRELQGQIAAITGIAPGCQRILVGYPPECLDLNNEDTVLGDLPIQSGPAGDILRFPWLPLWKPLSPPLHLASGDAREGAVASGAWLGTRDPRWQLRQHDERHFHPLGISFNFGERLFPGSSWP